MFHSINKNLNIQLFFLVLLFGWAGWTIFTQMAPMPTDGSMLLYQEVSKLWSWNPTFTRILVLIMVFLMTFGVIQHSLKNHFAENRSYMPGVFFLLMLNCGKFLQRFTPALLSVFFITLILLLYSPNEQASKMKDRLFDFGFLIAIATLLDISAFGIALFLILMVAINNVTSFKDIVILLSGISFPYIFAFSISFIANGLPTFVQSWRDVNVYVPIKQFTQMQVIEYVAAAAFLTVSIILMIRDKRLMDNKLIVIRQAFNNVNLLMISMLLFLFLGIVPLPAALIYLLPSVALYMSVAVTQKRYRYVMDVLIVGLCVLLWL